MWRAVPVMCRPHQSSLGAVPIEIDFSENMLAIVKKVFPGISFVRRGAQDLRFEDAAFNRVLVKQAAKGSKRHITQVPLQRRAGAGRRDIQRAHERGRRRDRWARPNPRAWQDFRRAGDRDEDQRENRPTHIR